MELKGEGLKTGQNAETHKCHNSECPLPLPSLPTPVPWYIMLMYSVGFFMTVVT